MIIVGGENMDDVKVARNLLLENTCEKCSNREHPLYGVKSIVNSWCYYEEKEPEANTCEVWQSSSFKVMSQESGKY